MNWRLVGGLVLVAGCGKVAAPPVVDRTAEAIGGGGGWAPAGGRGARPRLANGVSRPRTARPYRVQGLKSRPGGPGTLSRRRLRGI